MRDERPIIRVVQPEPANYKPANGLTRRQERESLWPEREARMQEHYERGEGYSSAVTEAYRNAKKRQFTREAIQDAAQGVGWKTGKLLIAFRKAGLAIPEMLTKWADAHVRNQKNTR